MEPLSALGLAAATAQFIDFGSKIIGHTKEIGKAGSSVSVEHLSTITSDLIEINSDLKHQLRSRISESVGFAKEEQVQTLFSNYAS